nr:SDR family NAD(P)-dependent oxidoreductase [Brevibacterium permense]
MRRFALSARSTSSAASILPAPGEATYAATKHGVLGYLKAVRTKMRGTGVHFTSVMPAVVDTVLAAGTGTGAGPLLRPDDVAQVRADARAGYEDAAFTTSRTSAVRRGPPRRNSPPDLSVVRKCGPFAADHSTNGGKLDHAEADSRHRPVHLPDQSRHEHLRVDGR